jgi:hypothetical protein
MRTIIIISVCLVFPLASFAAERVAVLPVSYTMYKTNASSEERALKVADAVAMGVERAGLEPVRGDEVTAASRELAPDGESYCNQPACAREVAAQVGAAFAVFVSVVDKEGQFDIEVLGTDSEPITASPFGTFRSMTRRVSGLVETSIREAVSMRGTPPSAPVDDETTSAGPKEEPPPPSPAPDNTAETVAPPVEDEDDGGISPVPFIVTSVLTGGLIAGYVSVEVIGYKRDQDNATEEDTRTLRITSRALLGCAATGVVASVVLFFLTDFHSGDAEAAKTARNWHVLPSLAPSGGGLLLEGRF